MHIIKKLVHPIIVFLSMLLFIYHEYMGFPLELIDIYDIGGIFDNGISPPFLQAQRRPIH
jgi:hypothetical protein